MKYNNKLKALREDKEPKLTQSEVAQKCGMTQRKLSFIENGVTEPSIEDLKALCQYFDISADYIIGLIDFPTTYKRKKN